MPAVQDWNLALGRAFGIRFWEAMQCQLRKTLLSARPRSSGIVQETGRPRMRPRFAAHPQCKDDVPCGLLEHVVVGGSDQAAIRA